MFVEPHFGQSFLLPKTFSCFLALSTDFLKSHFCFHRLSSELDNLWKQKWDFKKSVERAKKQEKVFGRRKDCPKCGSTNINFSVFYRPSIWKCLNCGYEGAFVVEDSKLAEKIQERHREK